VPMAQCSGGVVTADDIREKFAKVHRAYDEILSCEARYLISQGYRRIGLREVECSDGVILVLARKAGLKAKPGKRVSESGNRIEARGITSW